MTVIFDYMVLFNPIVVSILHVNILYIVLKTLTRLVLLYINDLRIHIGFIIVVICTYYVINSNIFQRGIIFILSHVWILINMDDINKHGLNKDMINKDRIYKDMINSENIKYKEAIETIEKLCENIKEKRERLYIERIDVLMNIIVYLELEDIANLRMCSKNIYYGINSLEVRYNYYKKIIKTKHRKEKKETELSKKLIAMYLINNRKEIENQQNILLKIKEELTSKDLSEKEIEEMYSTSINYLKHTQKNQDRDTMTLKRNLEAQNAINKQLSQLLNSLKDSIISKNNSECKYSEILSRLRRQRDEILNKINK